MCHLIKSITKFYEFWQMKNNGIGSDIRLISNGTHSLYTFMNYELPGCYLNKMVFFHGVLNLEFTPQLFNMISHITKIIITLFCFNCNQITGLSVYKHRATCNVNVGTFGKIILEQIECDIPCLTRWSTFLW